MTRCRWPGCRAEAVLTYVLDVALCLKHYCELCDCETNSPAETAALARIGLERVGGCVREIKKRKDGAK